MRDDGRGGVIDIDPLCLLPELLREHPEVRPVLDRHGLQGCGGPDGPYETIRYFARAHGIDEPRLIAEMQGAIARPETAGPRAAPGVADTIYRRYFTAGIVVVLTAGATWGAWLLWRIGLGGSFQGASLQSVNAHGAAQIYGWVGLFIMGFAYQAFPRIWHTPLVAPRLAVATLPLMLVGLVARTIGALSLGDWPGALSLAVVGGLLQVFAVLVFAGQVVATFRRSGQRLEPYVGFVMLALLWFALSSVFSVWHTWHTLTAGSEEALIWVVATYQAPLRDLQVHGLALFMILGVSLRMLPGLYNVPKVADRRAWWALGLLTTALIAEVLLFLAYRWTGNHVLVAFLLPAWALLAVGVALVALPWRLWRGVPEPDRGAKFIRMAYLWLTISLAMLLLMPAYQYAVGVRFSHAYSGAVRHAITVGFVSMMIMGIASKVVPTLGGIDPRTLSSLWGPFLLINVGCALRVVLQVLTDSVGAAYPLLGLSGTLEVAALTWWGVGLLALMWGRRAIEPAPTGPPPSWIEANHRVGDVVSWYPQTIAVLERFGFAAIRNPWLRQTVARQVTLARAAALRGVALPALLEALNDKVRAPGLTVLPSSGPSPRPSNMEKIDMSISVDLHATVGGLVTERPGRARVFDRLGIDYCCHGQVPFDEACARRGLDIAEVLRLLEENDDEADEAGEIDPDALSPAALADHIESTHHGYLRRELPRLEATLARVLNAHQDRHPELRELATVFAGLKDELESHMVKEEKVLFPIVRELEAAGARPEFHCGSVANPIRVMEHEHDQAGAALERIQELTDGYVAPGDGCATYRALMTGLADLEKDLHRHIHKENNILFPKARAVEAALPTG